MNAQQASARIEPQILLRQIARRYNPGEVAISFSGAEDVVLIDMAHRAGLAFEVFSLDTGRLHPETHEYLEHVRNHYGISIELLMPEPSAVAKLVREKGLFSFYRDGHNECCAVRKVEPLRRKLKTLRAWITGQRKDQGATRADLPWEQEDRAFSTPGHRLVKFNPLTDWTSRDVWAYIRERDVPYNALHDQGFVSIGCQPCTRPVGALSARAPRSLVVGGRRAEGMWPARPEHDQDRRLARARTRREQSLLGGRRSTLAEVGRVGLPCGLPAPFKLTVSVRNPSENKPAWRAGSPHGERTRRLVTTGQTASFHASSLGQSGNWTSSVIDGYSLIENYLFDDVQWHSGTRRWR